MTKLIDHTMITKAYENLQNIANETPVMTSRVLNNRLNAEAFLKCENFQRTGSFKFRGAYNTVSLLTDEQKKNGVIAHSSGNHAQALALVAKLFGMDCTVVMPSNSSHVKLEAVKEYGAKIVLCKPTPQDRQETTDKLIEEKGYTLIHPYDNDNTISGAGTCAYELLKEVSDLDFVFCPVGGGGLISGTSIASKGFAPMAKVIGVEPETANDAYQSLITGKMVPNTRFDTIADGLRTSLCQRTFEIMKQNVDKIVLVSEDEIVDAMEFLWERMKLVIEPSAAVSLAGLLKKEVDVKDCKIGVILSGGNVDLERFFMDFKSKNREPFN
jgi:threonine dehydratase